MTYKEFRSLVLNRYDALSIDDKTFLATRYRAMHPESNGSLKEKLKEELSQINPMEFKTFASGFVGHGRENSIAKNSLIYDLAYNYLTPEERLKIKDGATDFNANPFQDLNDDDFYRNLTWGTDRFKFDPNTKEAYLDGGNTFNWAYDMLDYGLDPNNVNDRNKYIGWMKEAQSRWNNQENSNPRNFTWSGEYNPQYRENGFHPLEWLSDNLIEGQWGNTQKNLANGNPEFATSDLVGLGIDVATVPLQSAKWPVKALGWGLDLANPFIKEGIETLSDDDKNFDTYVNNIGDMFSESVMRGAGNAAGGLIGNGVNSLTKKLPNNKTLENANKFIEGSNAKNDYDVFRKNMANKYAKEGEKPLMVDPNVYPEGAKFFESDAYGNARPVETIRKTKDGSKSKVRDDKAYNIRKYEGSRDADYFMMDSEQAKLYGMNEALRNKGKVDLDYGDYRLVRDLAESNKEFGNLYDSEFKVFENPFLDGIAHVVLNPNIDKFIGNGVGKFSAYATQDGLVEPSAMKPEELTTIASNIRNTKPEAYDNYLRYGYVGNLSDYEIKVLKEYALKTKSAAPLSQPNKSWDAYSVFN